jgi:flagellar assembly protein FliH
MQQFVVQIPRKVRRVEIIHSDSNRDIHEPIFEEFVPEMFEEFEETEQVPETISVEEAKEQIQVAYDRGFADGKQVATGTMMVEIQKQKEILKNFDTNVANLHSKFTELMMQAEDSIVGLALALAKNIVQEKVNEEKSVVIAQARKALQSLRGADSVVIRLNPVDLDALEFAQSTLLSDPMQMPNVKLESDYTIEEGGCIMESPLGTIDAQLKTQFEKLAEKLRQHR